MSFYTGSVNTSFSSLSSLSSRTSISSVATADERMPDYIFYRNLWWDKGELSEKAKWEEVTLPYVLAKNATFEDYEKRADEFNVHGCWEWLSNGEILIYEFPSAPHEVCIFAISEEITNACRDVRGTPTQIYGFGATRTRDKNRGKEADASFRPVKPAVEAPNGSDGMDFPWPNLVVEVAYSESLDHVEEALRYWLSPGRAHDCIVVKIDPVPHGQVPVRMRAWHYCISAGRGTRNTPPLVTEFEFGTIDGTGAQLNIVQGQCIINISLSCLYHDLKQPPPPTPPIQVPQNATIPLDFYFVQRAVTQAYNIH